MVSKHLRLCITDLSLPLSVVLLILGSVTVWILVLFFSSLIGEGCVGL
ncbi:hypothetical protein HanXRQr2_Chr08g0348551 [Helianthus annuus]|uniref:Uncharacterized protein n=1 Tax=Helianthus annuus TaxID=4232 RepID=A0A9K3ND98_HELAN|nr:hypothetical protein HanXRQr2_Chr08g0348551 [Helianthus annuus]KAJ0539564.1 hypothetical protein HanHA300_Chr08g0287791 [Helianthus annuus]